MISIKTEASKSLIYQIIFLMNSRAIVLKNISTITFMKD